VRVVTVVFSALAAIVLALWSYASGSVPIAAAAGLFAFMTVVVAFSGDRERHTAPAMRAPDALRLQSMPSSAVRAASQPVPSPAPVEEPDRESAAAEAETGAAPAPTHEVAPAPPTIRTPFSVQPTVVLMSLYDAVADRYDALAAHLWLTDASTETLRLVAAFGPSVPSGDLVPLSDAVLGKAARSGEATFDSLGVPANHDPSSTRWRYAVPVGTPEMRGVAAVDIATPDPVPSALVLNEITAVLRGSLTAALAIHVAHAEMETAVHLLNAAQELASGIGREDLLTAALDRAMLVASASTGSVMLPDPETGVLRIVAARGLSPEIVDTAQVAQGEGIAGVVYSSASPMLVEDLPGRPGARRHGVISSASIPIADAEGSLGVINVGSRAFPARLTDAYLRALGILGSQTALAMRNAEAAERSWDLYLENLQSLASALEANDPYRKDCSRRTAVLSVALGHAMGLDPDEIVSLRIAAILHDVGMGLATGSIGATDRPLSTVDRGLVRAHPKVASDVMASVPSLERLAPIVRHHHERYDGAGYDTGLSGDAIPLGSRILAVVDAFVSMTSERPYRAALDSPEALDELAAMAGSQFDPAVVDAFRRLLADEPEEALGR
jgi:hypothetical protein